ncbi:MAG TPA: response regulator [Kofleriaceae bacterium]|nr:response regulator [Kofleriaceae bacterium]
MTSVLVVEDDTLFRSTLARDLGSRGHRVTAATGVDDAVAELATGRFEVLLTDLRLGGRDGIDLLKRARAVAPATRSILMSGFASARDYQRAIELGAVRVLCKPFSSAELHQAIEHARDCSQGYSGSIHGLSLIDVLQLYQFGRRSIAIRVIGGQGGEILLRDGAFVHAARGELTGERALVALLATPSGVLRSETLPPSFTTTIDRPAQVVLLDCLRQLDEGGAETAVAMDDSGATPYHEGERSMGKMDDACREVVTKTDGAVACGIVDLDSGMLLGIHNSANYTQTMNEIVAAASMDLFRGPNVGRIEQMVRAHRGVPENGEHYFQEVHITSEHNYHFAKALKKGKAVIMLVTKKTTNIGMGWAQLKSVIPMVEPLVP